MLNTGTGRPAKGRPPVGPEVKIAFQPELLAMIDDCAQREGMTRAAWVREACKKAVHARNSRCAWADCAAPGRGDGHRGSPGRAASGAPEAVRSPRPDVAEADRPGVGDDRGLERRARGDRDPLKRQ